MNNIEFNMKLSPVGTSGTKIQCPNLRQVLSEACWGSGFSLVQLATGHIFSITFSLCFLLCFCWLSCNGLFSFLCLHLTLPMLFSAAFLYFCLSAFLPWFFFSLDNVSTCNLHNPTPVFMLLLKRSFLLVPHYLSLDVCLHHSVLLLFLCLLTAIASRNKVMLERIGFDTSVQISKASGFEKLTLSCY